MKQEQSMRADGGFTLPELLVAITIMVLVMGSLGFTLTSTMRSLSGAQERIERSRDTSLLGYVFPDDVNSATAITAGGTRPCGSSGTPLLQMTTTNVGSVSTGTIWYEIASDKALVRHECANSSIAQSTRLAESVSVPSSGPALVCQKQTAAAPYFAEVAGCSPAASINRVALTITINDASGGRAITSDSGSVFTLYGVMP